MKILFYSDNFYPEAGGLLDSMISLGRALKALGHDVAYVAPRYSAKDYAAIGKRNCDDSFIGDMKVFRVPSLPLLGSSVSGQERFVIPLAWSLSFARSFKPDIIHAQLPFGMGIEALYASRALNVPLVITNHGFLSATIKAHSPIKSSLPGDIADGYYRWYLRRTSFISTPSKETFEEIQKRGIRVRAERISNAISLDLFTPPARGEKEKIRKEFGIREPMALYTGRLAAEKEVAALIEAWPLV